jgi:Holliday junction resolvase RusA-like endonuclease
VGVVAVAMTHRPDGGVCAVCCADWPCPDSAPTAGLLSGIYDGMGIDAPALFKLQRELIDPEVVAHMVIEGEPQSKARARMTRNGHVYTPRTTREAMEQIGYQFRSENPGWQPAADGTFGVIALFYCATWQRRDVDNMLKLILDAFNRVVWADDSQVTEVSGRLVRGAADAGTEVVVYRTMAATKPTRACLRCGKHFEVYASQSTRKFCDRACGYAWRKEQRRVNCEHCGTEFNPHNGKAPARFCSNPCRYAARNVELTCDHCGKTYTKARSIAARSQRQACSPECVQALTRPVRAERARGTCATCGGPTSKRTYTNCARCKAVQK